jgi:predicted GNAT family acetyltransferase
LDAFSLNPFALRLYEKIGYVRVGEANWRKGLFYLYEKKI